MNRPRTNIKADPSEASRAAYETPMALREYRATSVLTRPEEALVTRFFRSDETILDLGCGGGRTTTALLGLGFAVVGLDLSATLLRVAASRCSSARFVQANARELPFKDESFRQALFSYNGLDCLHPRGDLIAALFEARRILKPGGIFIYSGHNLIGRFGRHFASVKRAGLALLTVFPRDLALQRRGSQPHRWYWRYGESFGELLMFSAPPYVHRRLHEQVGFDTVAVTGSNSQNSNRWLMWREHHVHYVVRRR